MTGTALATKDQAPTTGATPDGADSNSAGKALIREMAMDIGKDVAAYIPHLSDTESGQTSCADIRLRALCVELGAEYA